MSELFDDEEEKALVPDDDASESDAMCLEDHEVSFSDARKRLENLLEEKRLRDELEDFLD